MHTKVDDYPFIKDILWDRHSLDHIENRELFYLLEKRWKYIDNDNLSEIEKNFIERLVAEFGNGIILN